MATEMGEHDAKVMPHCQTSGFQLQYALEQWQRLVGPFQRVECGPKAEQTSDVVRCQLDGAARCCQGVARTAQAQQAVRKTLVQVGFLVAEAQGHTVGKYCFLVTRERGKGGGTHGMQATNLRTQLQRSLDADNSFLMPTSFQQGQAEQG
ncbi:hypothetical protein DVK02_15815, partial [Halobellus sp. Atlit-31R]